MPGKHYFCTFYLDGSLYGVEVSRVQEVLRYQALTPVPLASPAIRGLLNLRGQIVTAIDLRRRLELPDQAGDQLPMNLVVRTDEGAVSLLVDRIGEVVEVEDEGGECPPETLRGPARDLISAAYMLPDRLLLVLDTDRCVCLAEG